MGQAVKITRDSNLDKVLEQIPWEVRHKAIKSCLAAASRVAVRAAKAAAPRNKDPNHKPANKPLAETITAVYRDYGESNKFLFIVGPAYPAGAHGHLVEGGHKVVNRKTRAGGQSARYQPKEGRKSFVEGKKWMAPAVDSSRPQQEKAFETKLAKELAKYSKPQG